MKDRRLQATGMPWSGPSAPASSQFYPASLSYLLVVAETGSRVLDDASRNVTRVK